MDNREYRDSVASATLLTIPAPPGRPSLGAGLELREGIHRNTWSCSNTKPQGGPTKDAARELFSLDL